MVPTGDGIYVDISTIGSFPTRVVIHGPDGATDPNDRWCAPIEFTGGFEILWSEFNTECWDGGDGDDYNMEPIENVTVLVPGNAVSTTDFDFCLHDLTFTDILIDTDTIDTDTIDTADTDTGSGAELKGGGSTCDQYGQFHVDRSGTDYLVMNNAWNIDSQCIRVNQSPDYTFLTVTQQNGSLGTSGAPATFPEVLYGQKYSDSSSDADLPMQVSSISSVDTHFSHNANSGIPGTYNAAYDVWFNWGGDGSVDGAYLMVWLQHDSNIYPIGSLQETDNIAGRNWEVWSGDNGPSGAPYIAYVATTPTESETFDLMDFVNDAITRGVVDSAMYMANVQVGFEIWDDGVGLAVRDFYANVN